jgi:4-hydroxy 2-oxovalerate aldolase
MPGDVTLVDVTLRDGGYVNQHLWTRSDAAAIVSAVAMARIPLCEIGYFRPRRHESDGARQAAACCPPDYVAELRAREPGLTLVAMVHTQDVTLADYELLHASGVSMVRYPARLDVFPQLPAHIEAARAAGLRVTVNLIRASEVTAADVADSARLARDCGAEAFYLADSNGSLFPDDVATLVGAAAAAARIELGFHAHDGLSLAFVNSLTAMRAGCTYLDASLAGMGKGGGNLPLELIVGYLRSRKVSPFVMTPLVQTAETVLKPWKNGVAARCESIASSLLNMNIDNIAEYRDANGVKELVSIVDNISS